ncbi:MAG TPA: hypothetical protein VMI35_03825, partial [Puia sp.]|nr:hypothetical protein [Puia sp.]
MTQNKATTLEPFLVVSNGKKAVDFYISAFGAREIKRHARPGEKLYSKIAIEGAEFWVGDEEPEYDNLSPGPEGNNALRIILTTKNAD